MPRPAILAPIAIRVVARSAISGSRAALRMVVVPAAATDQQQILGGAIGSAAAPQRGQQCAEQQYLGAHAGDQLGIDPLRLHAIGRDRHGEARVACRPMHAAAPARYGCSMSF